MNRIHKIDKIFEDGKAGMCGHVAKYSEKYDADFCPTCNIWIQAKCSDKECLCCLARPLYPNEAIAS